MSNLPKKLSWVNAEVKLLVGFYREVWTSVFEGELSEDKSFVILRLCLLLICGFVVRVQNKGILE